MLAAYLLAALTVTQAEAPSTLESDLRRAINEYAYGNYDKAIQQLNDLLYPMRLATDEEVIEARKYLALSHFLLERYDLMGEEFAKLLHLEPDYQLDPFTVAPPVIEQFELVRKKLKPQLDMIRDLRTDTKIEEATATGVRVEIEKTFKERSEFATFMPFGIGQFQNGNIRWGVIFAVTEVLLLAANIVSYLYAVEGIGNGYLGAESSVLLQRLAITQYGSAALFGLVWSLGVFHARLHFVPIEESPRVVREIPFAAKPGLTPGLAFSLQF